MLWVLIFKFSWMQPALLSKIQKTNMFTMRAQIKYDYSITYGRKKYSLLDNVIKRICIVDMI